MIPKLTPRSLGVVAALLGAATTIVVACSSNNDAPSGTSSGVASSGGAAQCATPQEGCPCATPGESVPCGEKIRGGQDFVYCYEGQRKCTEAGVYGKCMEGRVSLHSTSAVSGTKNGLKLMGLGSGTTCASAGDGGINPCDPYCSVFSDTPAGIDAGGFSVVDGGIQPTFACGNSVVSGGEQCDDGNITNGDGCNSICQLEVGFYCPTPGSPCVPSTCGNGTLEGLEQCDDGNLRPYDGCSPTCTKEPVCPVGSACTAVCGDGVKFPSEACDDGNNIDGDGCSSTCTVEAGATCNTVTATAPAYIDVPVIFRDFDGNTHPDFQKFAGVIPHNVPPVAPYYYSGTINCANGLVQNIPAVTLAADKEPVMFATQNCTAGAGFFYQWFHDDATVNKVILGRSLRLFQAGAAYVFDSTNDTVTTNKINCGNGTAVTCQSQGGFWPINGQGWGNWAATGKNFHFTSEVRYPFTYSGGEVLSFSGDDDVFVYVKGVKVVDLGGVHGAVPGSVTLNGATTSVPAGTPLAFVAGETYEIVVFQAERNTTGSNYKLTLQGFNRTTSQCTVPPPPQTLVRDFQAICPVGTEPVWQLFRWQAMVPATQSIVFRAGTADTQAALPAASSDPTTVPIGTADPVNSPVGGPLAWTYDTMAVSGRLAAAVPSQKSKQWLRVFMTFNGTPTLNQWQQLYDCVPSE